MNATAELMLPAERESPDLATGSLFFIGNATVLLRYAGLAIPGSPQARAVRQKSRPSAELPCAAAGGIGGGKSSLTVLFHLPELKCAAAEGIGGGKRHLVVPRYFFISGGSPVPLNWPIRRLVSCSLG
ncbi:MAG: hypothetical protein AB1671_03375 [Thermodesulfobacteriota bacterium]|jgi:hypothetical protein